jgi:catechol 2,3-dioxygenase-like lactoylglutathione lyase family enzyme
MMVEKISAVTFRAANMRASVQFYRDVLGTELLHGGEDAFFSSLRAKGASAPIHNPSSLRSASLESSLWEA